MGVRNQEEPGASDTLRLGASTDQHTTNVMGDVPQLTSVLCQGLHQTGPARGWSQPYSNLRQKPHRCRISIN